MTGRVLLTGATGFLGRHTLDALCQSGREVCVLKRATSDISALLAAHPGLTFLDAEDDSLASAFKAQRIESIVHLASDQGRGQGGLASLLRTNVLLGVHLLEAATEAGVMRFINADTQLEAGVNAYARSKKQFAQWLPQFADALAIANLRLGNIYGPGENEGGFLSWLLGEFARNTGRIDFTPGEQVRDFVHVRDVSAAILAVLDRLEGTGLQQYDVGSGQMNTLRHFVETAYTAYRGQATLTSSLNFGGLPYRAGEVMQPVFDTAPLLAMGWRPQFDLAAGLADTVAAFLQDAENST